MKKNCKPGKFIILLLSLLFTADLVMAAGPTRHDDIQDSIWVSELREGINRLTANQWFEKTQIGLCIYDLTADSALIEINAHQRLRPASTMKLLTSITALTELGGAYQFKTQLHYTGEIHDSILYGNLYVTGGFDPRFGHDDMQAFISAISALAVDSIAGGLYADLSLKDTLQWGYGWCWDDDMPKLTPLLYKEKDCFINKLTEHLLESGITFHQTGKALCPPDATLLSVRTHSIDQILMPMMKESDNLYAEALFYQLGSLSHKKYASYKEAGELIHKMIRKLHMENENCLIADGSGVSLYNYITPATEIAFLRHAYNHQEIFQHLYNSLPVAGKDGTLKNRMKKGAAHKQVRAKTGTLEGIISLAGYATASNSHLLAFCIINQGVDYSRKARDFQDKVCELLCQ